MGSTCVVTDDTNPYTEEISSICATDGARIKLPADKTITIKPHASVTVPVTVVAGSTTQWLGGWVTFTSANPARQPSLSVPMMGFAGDWNAETIIATPADQKTGHDALDNVLKTVYEVEPDSDTQTGLSATQDGYTEAILEAPLALSPKQGDFTITPRLALYRTASDIQADIVDASGRVRATRKSFFPHRALLSYYTPQSSSPRSSATAFNGLSFDGYVWDADTQRKVMLPEGRYEYRIKARLGAAWPWQKPVTMPFFIDSTPPQASVDSVTCATATDCTVKVSASDSLTEVYALILRDSDGANCFYESDGKGHYTVFGVPVSDLGKIVVTDSANNRTVIDAGPPSKTFILTNGKYFTDILNARSVDIDTGQPLIVNNRAILRGIAAADIAAISVDGHVQHRPAAAQGKPWMFTLKVPVAAGSNTIVVKAEGPSPDRPILYTRTLTFAVDNVAPTISDLKYPGGSCLKLNVTYGTVTLSGISAKVSDNLAATVEVSLYDERNHLYWSGNVTNNATVSINNVGEEWHGSQSFQLVASDGYNTTSVAISPCPITIDATDDMSDIAVAGTWTVAPDQFMVWPGADAMTQSGDRIMFTLRGQFAVMPKRFRIAVLTHNLDIKDPNKIDYHDVEVGADKRFSYPITVPDGTLATVIYNVDIEQADKTTTQLKRNILVPLDLRHPTMNLKFVPGISSDGTIYINKPSGCQAVPIAVSGRIGDNMNGYYLFVDNTNIANLVNNSAVGGYQPISLQQSTRDVSLSLPVDDQSVHRLFAVDNAGNSVTRYIPVVCDNAAPTIDVRGLKNNDVVKAAGSATVGVSDPYLKEAQVYLDGKPLEEKSIASWHNPNAQEYQGLFDKPHEFKKLGGAKRPSTLDFTIPFAGLANGQHTVVVNGIDMAGNPAAHAIVFTVQSPEPKPAPPSGGGATQGNAAQKAAQKGAQKGASHGQTSRGGSSSLAVTGTNAAGLVAASLMLIIGGVFLVFLRRGRA